MSPASARTRRAGKSIPALLIGVEGHLAERAREALGEVPTRVTSRDETLELLGTNADVGVLVLLCAADGDALDGLEEMLDAARSRDPGLPLFIVAEDALSGVMVARALRAGAAEVGFVGEGGLGERIEPLVARRASRGETPLLPEKSGMPRILGSSPGMKELARLLERVSGADATVLVLGESGTGKELVARAVHVLSPRRKGPFIAINCAAIPETLLENELFGHEKGSYTGANATAIGKVEAAEKGTLFLDEIGEMPLQLQAKILRLLQEKTYDRIGGTRTRKADVRIVTATNRDLKEQVAARTFREDLYYRLNVVPLVLPALRERPDDIPVLARAILERVAASSKRPGLRFSDDAMQRLVEYRWPGNVRELENEIERAAVLASTETIEARDLELRSRVSDPDRAALARLAPVDGTLQHTLEALMDAAIRIRIAQALADEGGDREEAARQLGIDLGELNEKLTS